MVTRIIFNGQEYQSAEAMPAEVRQAYEQALARFADADGNGIPDILEQGVAGNVIGIQHSCLTVNGRTFNSVEEMPAVVHWLYEQSMAQVGAQGGVAGALPVVESGLQTPSDRDGRPGLAAPSNAWTLDRPPQRDGTKAFRRIDRTLEGVLRAILWVAAVGIFAAAIAMIVAMEGASRSQGGRFYVAIGAMVLLGAVDKQFTWLARRRWGMFEPNYTRYILRSLLLLAGAAVVLFGLALLWP